VVQKMMGILHLRLSVLVPLHNMMTTIPNLGLAAQDSPVSLND
jgi:hypothetical protein